MNQIAEDYSDVLLQESRLWSLGKGDTGLLY